MHLRDTRLFDTKHAHLYGSFLRYPYNAPDLVKLGKSNFKFSCNAKLLQIIITAQQLIVSADQSKGQICRFHRFHVHLHPHPHRCPAT